MHVARRAPCARAIHYHSESQLCQVSYLYILERVRLFVSEFTHPPLYLHLGANPVHEKEDKR
jgi:hypothetical protein